MQEKILIWEGSKRISVEKEEIVKIFLKELAHQRMEGYRYFYPIYSDILQNVERIQAIQIYKDGEIRLHLTPETDHSPKTSVFLDKFKREHVKGVLETFFY